MRLRYRAVACVGCSCALVFFAATIVFATLFASTARLNEEVDCAKEKNRLVWQLLPKGEELPPSTIFWKTIDGDGVLGPDVYVGDDGYKCAKYWGKMDRRRLGGDDEFYAFARSQTAYNDKNYTPLDSSTGGL